MLKEKQTLTKLNIRMNIPTTLFRLDAVGRKEGKRTFVYLAIRLFLHRCQNEEFICLNHESNLQLLPLYTLANIAGCSQLEVALTVT